MSDTNAVPQRTKRGLDPTTAAELGDLLHELSQDKKTRKIIAKAIKEKLPDSPYAAQFSDVEQEDRFDAFKREQEEARLKEQQTAVLAAMNAKRARLIAGDGGRKFSEDQVKEIEALMQARGIVDYDDGAVLYAAKQPPESPQPGKDIPMHGQTWEFPEWGKFGADPVKASREVAAQTIGEFMRKRN
jgi:hypothetical protein